MIKNPSLFLGFGIEAEYMIVDSDTLDISPNAELLLTETNGDISNEIENGECCWSNELALHVIEIKTNGPVSDVASMESIFPNNILAILNRLKEHNLTLLPTAMHPWMNPDIEFKIWKRGNREIYDSYNQIFNCKGHGWSNLQSVHLNIGFQGDEEFYKLHSAIRLILPLIPMIAASSPYIQGTKGNFLDNRIDFYSKNQSMIPEITGDIIPEITRNKQDYINSILNPIYKAIQKYDPEGILQDEWLNSRGAIARFDRSAIEIRVMDIQESPQADSEILSRIIILLKYLIYQNSPDELSKIPSDYLVVLFWEGVKSGSRTKISNSQYLKLFGIDSNSTTGVELFFSRDSSLQKKNSKFRQIIENQGNLSERILRATGESPSLDSLKTIYKKLNHTLITNDLFKE